MKQTVLFLSSVMFISALAATPAAAEEDAPQRRTDRLRRAQVHAANQPDIIYTVNSQTDELVKIDAATGTPTVVGPVGHDMHSTDLEFHHGVLYAITPDTVSRFQATKWFLVTIDHRTGANTSVLEMKAGTQVPTLADGIVSIGNTLFAAVDFLDLTASAIADLDPTTGQLTNIIDYESVTGVNHDFDGLGVTDTGQMIVVDSIQFS